MPVGTKSMSKLLIFSRTLSNMSTSSTNTVSLVPLHLTSSLPRSVLPFKVRRCRATPQLGPQLPEILSQYGAPVNVIVPGFGMTETCTSAIFHTKCPIYDKERSLEFTSVGACMPGIKMRITEGTNNDTVPTGVVGNLEISGPVVFKGYFNNPTATEESFSSDGWFKTGDKALIDETGYLTLQSRSKEAMVINGVKYSPHEIETALDESKIPGLTPSFNCCFSYFPPGNDTEKVCVVFLPSFAPEDTVTRVETVDAISKSVMMATGSKPQVLPLDRSQLQKTALGKLSRNRIKTS